MTTAPTRRRRAFITGIGVLTAIGTGLPAFRAGPPRRAAPVKRIDRFDPSPFRVAGRGPGRRLRAARPHGRPGGPRRSTGSASSAWRPAGWRWPTPGSCPGAAGAPAQERIGIYLGSALGGIAFAEIQHEQYLARGLRGVSPTLALAVFGGAAPANLGIALDVRGPILSTANSCASGAVAIGEALNAIRDGEIDAAIAGGVECPLSPLAFGAFDLIRALGHGYNDDPPHAARPMDAGRDGFVMGEGAALLVIEAEDIARARGARPTPRSWATARPRTPTTWSSPDPTAARPGARSRSRSRTPASAPDEIDWVSAHASSTPIGDIAEARALAAPSATGRRPSR